MLIKKYIFLRRKKKIRIFHPVRILQTHNDHNKMETSSLLLSRLDMIIFLSFVILLPPIFWRIRVCVCVSPRPRITFYTYIYTSVVFFGCIRNFWNVYFYFLNHFWVSFFFLASIFFFVFQLLRIFYPFTKPEEERMCGEQWS
jgi:hypothetical protein